MLDLYHLELLASGFTLLCVWLLARQNIYTFLWGIIGVLLYGYIFYESHLFADATLQWAYFLPIQIYGWWYWYTKGPQPNTLSITVLTWWQAAFWTVVTAIGTLIAWYLFAHYTSAALPAPDSFILVASMVAQYLLSQKKLDNWIIWIAVDIVAIPTYAYKELYVTTGLYTILLGLASYGLYTWTKERHTYNIFGRAR